MRKRLILTIATLLITVSIAHAQNATGLGYWTGVSAPVFGAITVTSININGATLTQSGGGAVLLVGPEATKLGFLNRSKINPIGDGQFVFENTGVTAGVGIDFAIDNVLAVKNRAQTAAGVLALNSQAAATSTYKLVKKVTSIADNTATAVLTVTVPNANHAATVRLTLLSSNGSTDAFESSRTADGAIVLTRTTGVATVAVAATLTLTGIATVAAGATHTLAYSVSAMSGAVGATQTFTINVTIDDSGNLGSNQAVVMAELINGEATGVTIQ